MDSFQTPFWELPIAFAMNESVRNRIGEMTDEEREVLRQKSSLAGGDFSRDPSVEWDHELGDIGRGINDLSENVSELMEKRLEDEKQKQDLEYNTGRKIIIIGSQ